jgi:hypothetical protein
VAEGEQAMEERVRAGEGRGAAQTAHGVILKRGGGVGTLPRLRRSTNR